MFEKTHLIWDCASIARCQLCWMPLENLEQQNKHECLRALEQALDTLTANQSEIQRVCATHLELNDEVVVLHLSHLSTVIQKINLSIAQ